MRLDINNNEIIEIINSIKKNRKELRDLENYSRSQWGVIYWLNKDFQNSENACFMEWLSASIHYDLHKYESYIHLN